MPSETLDDDRIGLPIPGRYSAPMPMAQDAPVVPEPLLRSGETDLGRPLQIPSAVSPLTDTERKSLQEAEEQQALLDLQEAEDMTASDPAVSWLGWFTHPLAAALLIGSVGALGLFLTSQVLTILANLASQPAWVQYLGYAGLVCCGGAVLSAMVRFTLLYVRLQRNRQFRLAGLTELQQRTKLRWLAHAKAGEAKGRLEDYLRDFPISTERDKKKWMTGGISEERVQTLLKVRSELLDPARFTSSQEWFARFQTGFQGELDAAASIRIAYWARRSGLATAMAPNGLIDSVAVSYFGFALITDLCRIYHLRAGRTGTAVLLGRVFFNSYLAGQMNEWEKLTEEQLDHLIAPGGHFIAPGGPMGDLVVSRMFSKLGAKATSGLLNYFLLQRLGKSACRLLRPVS